MKIAVLAVQGAFIEHEKILESLGASCIELRQKSGLEQKYDGIILPGGESTVQGKLLKELNMFSTIKTQIEQGMPVLATCAGMILLADKIEVQENSYFGTIPMTVRRNAYGRQLGSFHVNADLRGIGTIPMTFIRAPFATEVGDGVEILSTVEDRIVALRYQKQIALAFHPELDNDIKIHKTFLSLYE